MINLWNGNFDTICLKICGQQKQKHNKNAVAVKMCNDTCLRKEKNEFLFVICNRLKGELQEYH